MVRQPTDDKEVSVCLTCNAGIAHCISTISAMYNISILRSYNVENLNRIGRQASDACSPYMGPLSASDCRWNISGGFPSETTSQ